MSLIRYLQNKPIYYKKIDYNHIKEAFALLKQHIKIPTKIIHIVGTNGKGSSGRFLAYYLSQKGFDTLHYSSPHILKFNERIWINGEDSSDKQLNKAHKKLQKILPNRLIKRLSYFEYTTLIAFVCSNSIDYLILEAGLGGEFDATNVIDSDISIVTPIDLDHQEFLGNSIKSIAKTKIRSVQNQMILANQSSPKVAKVAQKLSLKNGFEIYTQNELLSKSEQKSISKFISQNSFASYLTQNLELAMSVIKLLDIEFDKKYLKDIILKGRMQKIAENIYVDVGHNRLASQVILDEFLNQNQKINLIYNSAKDKDYKSSLKILAPIIKNIYPIKSKNNRLEDIKNIKKIAKKLKIPTKSFKNIKFKDDEVYLVFGSFIVVEEFLHYYA
jgi:dihydrofolate synthase/folylpolyglutamate synthase